jgi:glycosyltransferase involved in cell wall biosynthesis
MTTARDGAHQPSVSVVITANTRKRFLSAAIRSVLAQDLERQAYDVTVVKSFEDSEIDDYLAEASVSVVNFQHANMGACLLTGVRATSGRIISFLEDDDIWKPGKLKSVVHAFEEGDVVYYKDAHEPIDESGKPMAGPAYTRPRNRISVANPCANPRAMLSFIKARGDVNLSSTSISRSILQRVEASTLPLISAGPDWFMFYLALVSRGRMIVDDRVLTGYRIHGSTVNPTSSNLKLFVQKRQGLVERELQSLAVMEKTFDDPVVASLIQTRIETDKVQLRIVRGRRGIDSHIHLISPKSVLDVRRDRYGLALFVLFLISLASARTAQALYKSLYVTTFL